MSYRSLRDFIAKLEAAGELVRVGEPVSTVLEMTEIQTRLIAQGGPAALFEKPLMGGAPGDIPVLVNLFGTVKRVAMGVTLGGKERTTAAELREVGELLAAQVVIDDLRRRPRGIAVLLLVLVGEERGRGARLLLTRLYLLAKDTRLFRRRR